MNIYIDFDDCLCETGKAFADLAARLFGTRVPYEEMRYFNLQHAFGLTEEQYAFYMSDPVHPTRAGYRDWWTPIMEKELYRIAEEKCRR